MTKNKITYHIEIVPEIGGEYFVEVRELSGCMSDGETISKSMLNIADALRCWIISGFKHGELDIPLPSDRQRGGQKNKREEK